MAGGLALRQGVELGWVGMRSGVGNHAGKRNRRRVGLAGGPQWCQGRRRRGRWRWHASGGGVGRVGDAHGVKGCLRWMPARRWGR